MKNKFKKWDKVFWLERSKIASWKVIASTKVKIDDKKAPEVLVYWIIIDLVQEAFIYEEALDFISEKELYFSETELKNNL